MYIFVISSRLQPDQKRIKKESNVTEELVPNSSGSNVGGASSKGWYFYINNVPFRTGKCRPLSFPESPKLCNTVNVLNVILSLQEIKVDQWLLKVFRKMKQNMSRDCQGFTRPNKNFITIISVQENGYYL